MALAYVHVQMTSKMTRSRDSKLKMAVCERVQRESAIGTGNHSETRARHSMVIDRVPCPSADSEEEEAKRKQEFAFALVTRIASEGLHE